MVNFNKIKLIAAILAIVAGIGFVVFAIFFNRSTLQISAQGPFDFNIQDVRSESCSSNLCSTVLAPGKYSLTLTKSGYLNITDQIELKRGETTSKTYQFQKEPQVQLTGVWNPPTVASGNFLSLNLPIPATLWTNLSTLFIASQYRAFAISPAGNSLVWDDGGKVVLQTIASDQKLDLPIPAGSSFSYVTPQMLIYLADDQNRTQNLFLLDLTNPQLVPSAITSFGRKITSAKIVALPDLKKIALIDQSDPQDTGLYIIDNVSHTRNIFDRSPAILDLKWLSDTTFLVQKRNIVSFANEIYFGDLSKPGLQLLNLTQNLSSIYPLNSTSLLIAKSLSSVADSADPYQANGGFFLQKYDLHQPDQPVNLFTVPDLPSPAKLQYDSANKNILFLSGGNLYTLNLEVK